MTPPTRTSIELWEEFRLTLQREPHAWERTIQLSDGSEVELLDLTSPFASPLRGALSLPPSIVIIVRSTYKEHLAHIMVDQANLESKGLVMIGQPGTGKSTFLAWALVQLLGRRQKVAFEYNADSYLVFSEEGVAKCSGDHIIGQEPQRVIGLSNSGPKHNQPSEGFRASESIYIVQATSPLENRWASWKKETSASLSYMDIWSSSELEALAGLRNLDVASVLNAALLYGPAPRTTIDYLRDPRTFESQIKRTINSIRSDNITQMISAILQNDGLSSSTTSSWFWTRPVAGQPVPRSLSENYVPTPTLSFALTERLVALEEADRLKLLKSFGSLTLASTRAVAGCFFEAAIHAHLLSGKGLTVHWYESLPIRSSRSGPVRSSKSRQPLAPSTPIRQSPRRPRSGPSTQSRRPPAPSIPDLRPAPPLYQDLDQVASHHIPFGDLSPTRMSSFYWRPKSPNFPAIDSVLFVKGCIYVIQATISWRHGSIVSGEDGSGWMQLQPHIQPLLVRGAVVVCLYLVDDDEKGRNLCAANSGSGDDIPRGYCNLSSHLKSVIEKFKDKNRDPKYLMPTHIATMGDTDSA